MANCITFIFFFFPLSSYVHGWTLEVYIDVSSDLQTEIIEVCGFNIVSLKNVTMSTWNKKYASSCLISYICICHWMNLCIFFATVSKLKFCSNAIVYSRHSTTYLCTYHSMIHENKTHIILSGKKLQSNSLKEDNIQLIQF